MKQIILILTLSVSLNLFSQNNAEDKLGAWYMYGGSHKISTKWKLKSLAHFRLFETTNDLQQLLVRGAGNYTINKTLNASVGYAYLNTDATYNVSGGDANEHRIYEDFNIKHTLNKLNFAHRFRLEHRFFETDTRHWIRYQIGLSYPIVTNWSTYFFNELFLNFEGKAYAQNWIGGGITYKVSDLLKLKGGYINIAQNNSNFERIQLGIVINTNHQKKK